MGSLDEWPLDVIAVAFLLADLGDLCESRDGLGVVEVGHAEGMVVEAVHDEADC